MIKYVLKSGIIFTMILVLGTLLIPLITKDSMIEIDESKQTFISISYNDNERSGTYKGNFDIVHENIDNILEVIYQSETREFIIDYTYDDGFTLIILDIGTDTVINFKRDNTWEYPEGAIEFDFENEYAIVFILDIENGGNL